MAVFFRYRVILFFLVIVSVFAACDNRADVIEERDHPNYIDSAFNPYLGVELDSARHDALIDSAYNALTDPGPGDKWDKYFYLFMHAYSGRVNLAKSSLYIDSMIYAMQGHESDANYLERYSKALFYKGDVLINQHRYAEAFSYYYQAREVINRKNDPCILSEYSSRLAGATYRQERYLEAIIYYKQVVHDLEACDTKTTTRFGEIQGALDNIGLAYMRAGLYDSANIYFNKAIEYINDNVKFFPDRTDFADVAKSVIYGNQAGVAIKRGHFAVAESLLKESIRVSEVPGHPDEDAGFSLIKLVKIYLQQQRIPESEREMEKLSVISKKYPANVEISSNFILLQSRLAALKGDSTRAYRHLRRYQQIVDSVQQQAAPIPVGDMQQSIDNISRQYQLDILAADNKRKSGYLWLTMVIATLAIVIIILVWITYRRYKKNVFTLLSLNQAVSSKNQALLQTLAALEQSHTNNTRLLKVVAHDLRGPLGAITSIAELAGDGMLPGEKYQEVMAIIFRSGTKALTLANHLLMDMQTIGQLSNPEPLSIAEQLANCVELYEHRIKEKQQTVVLQTVPAFVNGDREKLWRVFSNLISNAVKFTRVNGQINISMLIKDNDVIISVKDNGIGIPDDMKDRIFEPTEATTRAGTIGERSFGLGLSITKSIVALHSGTLWFESDNLEGSTFFVSLPLLKTEN